MKICVQTKTCMTTVLQSAATSEIYKLCIAFALQPRLLANSEHLCTT